MAFNTTNLTLGPARASAQRAAAELANAIAALTLSRALTAAGIAPGITAQKVKTVNALTYQVKGRFFSKAGTDDFWTLSGTTVAVSSFQKYLMLIDTAGAASIAEGTQTKISAAAVTWKNLAGASDVAALLQAILDTKAIVGVVTVATDAVTTFVPGTTALNAAGITATFIDGVDQSLVPLLGNPAGTLIGNGG